MKAEKQVAAAKAKAAEWEDRFRHEKGQLESAKSTIESLTHELKTASDSIGYLEKILALEEKPGQSNVVCEQHIQDS